VAHRILFVAGALLIPVAMLAACGASETPVNAEDKASSDKPADSASPSASAAADAPVKWSDKVSNKQKDDSLTEDQKAQMEVALRRGGEKAAQCINVAADAKPGEGEVKVTFDGKIGKATEVEVGDPWKGVPLVESCIKRAFIGEYIVPFEGSLEVPYTVKLGKSDAADKKDPKAKDAKKDPKAKDPKKK
jgi:hypothetical protein